ncbi:hypothetical protein [Streptomyces rubellomurinus]|uniref:hypothetical protein n=1 Tax=Streptomyces rubellomurinus (strain ATCC 31215) TaxID=359131 RepID=UPI0012FECE03|nr:hypothetical protein [Streptomyces rubellomurinus]
MITSDATSRLRPALGLRAFESREVSVSLGSVIAAAMVPLACANGLPWWQFVEVGWLVTVADQTRYRYQKLRLE